MKTEAESVENVIIAVRARRAREPRPVARPDWRKAVGMLKDSKESQEAFRLGAEWRERMSLEGR